MKTAPIPSGYHPFGHKWMLATHTADLPPAELSRRATELFGTTCTGTGT